MNMKWERYHTSFCRTALRSGVPKDLIDTATSYAYNLYSKNLPIIYDVTHLSLLIGYSTEYIYRAVNCIESSFYRTFKINKKSGGIRFIQEPLPSLKEIQRWLLDNLFTRMHISKYAKGFVPKLSIKDNARFHLRQPMVLALDVHDFFPSIKSVQIYNILREAGYCKSVSKTIEKLCSLGGGLPQGAPTSPCISNIIMTNADKRIAAFASKNKLRYTRYADDITLSGNFDVSYVIRTIESILHDYGLRINETKTRLMRPNVRQEVTGITVNSFMQTSRHYRRELRKEIYYIKKFGLSGHLSHVNNMRANYVKHLKGVANHILHINPKDRDALDAVEFLKHIGYAD